MLVMILKTIGIVCLCLVVIEMYPKNKAKKKFWRIVVLEVLAIACFVLSSMHDGEWKYTVISAIFAVAIIWFSYLDKKETKV